MHSMRCLSVARYTPACGLFCVLRLPTHAFRRMREIWNYSCTISILDLFSNVSLTVCRETRRGEMSGLFKRRKSLLVGL